MRIYWPKRYATGWEGQVQTRFGGVWFGILYPRFWKTSKPAFIRLTDREGSPK